MASRMESNSVANRILCSEPTARLLLRENHELSITARGLTDIKGKGLMHTFWVDSVSDSADVVTDYRSRTDSKK